MWIYIGDRRLSLNTHTLAERPATSVNKAGKKVSFVDTREFHAWQTPTAISRKIANEPNVDMQHQMYVRWVMMQDIPEDRYPTYDDAGNQVGEEVHSPIDDHLDGLSEWIDECDRLGFTVKFIMR